MSIADLKDKIVIVTGASRGIGKSIALQLAAEKVKLVLVSRGETALRETAAAAEMSGSETLCIPADLSNIHEPVRIIEKTAEIFGGVDILVNNAGTALHATLEETTVEQWELQIALNARAPFLLCQAALPYLRKSSDPVVLNIASVVGRKGYAQQAAYSASKHALLGFTKAFAREMQADGIRVLAVSPGGTATDLIDSMRPDLDRSNLITPDEVAETVLFLLRYRGNAAVDEIYIRRANGTPWD